MTFSLKHVAIPMSILTEFGIANSDSSQFPSRWASISWRDSRMHSIWLHFKNESVAWGFGLGNSFKD